eukprot:gene8896-biopygen3173
MEARMLVVVVLAVVVLLPLLLLRRDGVVDDRVHAVEVPRADRHRAPAGAAAPPPPRRALRGRAVTSSSIGPPGVGQAAVWGSWGGPPASFARSERRVRPDLPGTLGADCGGKSRAP